MAIPENQREAYIAKKMPSRMKDVKVEVEVEDEAVEIRTVNEKEYIVHKIKPMKDTVFNLSLKYKVSEKSIKEANKIAGSEIFTLKEVLITYKG